MVKKYRTNLRGKPGLRLAAFPRDEQISAHYRIPPLL